MTEPIELQLERDLQTIAALEMAKQTIGLIGRLKRLTTVFPLATATVEPSPTKGIDISQHTSIVDGNAAKAGVHFAIVRSRDGFRDDQKFQVNRAWSNSLTVDGSYGYFNPRWNEGAPGGARQAAEIWGLHKFGNFELPPVLDLENAVNFVMPHRHYYLNELYPAVMDLASYAGRYPIVYSNLSFFDNYLLAHQDEPDASETFQEARDKTWLRNCPLWIAWPSTTAMAPRLPKAFKKAVLWQRWLDNTSHPGLSVCDVNYFPGSLAQLQAWCRDANAAIPDWGSVDPGTPPVPPITDPTLKELDARLKVVEADVASGKISQAALIEWAKNVGLK